MKNMISRRNFLKAAGAVSAAAQKEEFSRVPEGDPAPGFVHIHAAHFRSPVQRDAVGSLLIHFHKIHAVAVPEGKMGGHDILVRFDFESVLRQRPFLRDLPDAGPLIDPKLSGHPGHQLQRIDLPLIREFHRPHHGKGQAQGVRKLRRIAQFFQRSHFPLQLSLIVSGIDEGIPSLKGDVQLIAQLRVLLHGGKARGQIHPRRLHPLFPDQPVVDQTVLGSHLRRGVPGIPSAQNVPFRQRAIHPRPLQKPGAHDSRDPASDHQHVRPDILRKLRKPRHPRPHGPQ